MQASRRLMVGRSRLRKRKCHGSLRRTRHATGRTQASCRLAASGLGPRTRKRRRSPSQQQRSRFGKGAKHFPRENRRRSSVRQRSRSLASRPSHCPAESRRQGSARQRPWSPTTRPRLRTSTSLPPSPVRAFWLRQSQSSANSCQKKMTKVCATRQLVGESTFRVLRPRHRWRRPSSRKGLVETHWGGARRAAASRLGRSLPQFHAICSPGRPHGQALLDNLPLMRVHRFSAQRGLPQRAGHRGRRFLDRRDPWRSIRFRRSHDPARPWTPSFLRSPDGDSTERRARVSALEWWEQSSLASWAIGPQWSRRHRPTRLMLR